jgi:hypothetical protein
MTLPDEWKKGQTVRLASPADLVRMKREAGRRKDIDDIRALGYAIEEDADEQP